MKHPRGGAFSSTNLCDIAVGLACLRGRDSDCDRRGDVAGIERDLRESAGMYERTTHTDLKR